MAAVVRPHADGVELGGVLVAVQALVLDLEAELAPLLAADSAAHEARHHVRLDAVRVPGGLGHHGHPGLILAQLGLDAHDLLQA